MKAKHIAILETRLGDPKGARVIIQRFGSANVALDRALERGEIHAAVFTNAEQARNLAVNVGLESKPPKLGALMSALESALS